MKAGLSKVVVLGILVAGVLATGTVLVSGYVDKPDHAAQVLAENQCNGCPFQGTGACCKVAGSCDEQACPAPCAQTCDMNEPAGGCRQMTGTPGPVQRPCGAGGCACPE